MDRSTIANHLRLLELPRELQEDVEEGALTIGHAKALLQVQSPERRRQLRDRIVAGRSRCAPPRSSRGPRRAPRRASRERARGRQDPHLEGVTDPLRQRLKTRVRIKGTAERGRIEIEYFGAEDFDRISGVLLGDG